MNIANFYLQLMWVYLVVECKKANIDKHSRRYEFDSVKWNNLLNIDLDSGRYISIGLEK